MAKETFIEVGGREVRVSNPDKVYFPEPGYTKLQVVEYYGAVSELMLKYVVDRPTALERWPDGVQPDITMAQRGRRVNPGEAFYQKRVPTHAPDWIKSHQIAFPSGRTADEITPTEPAVIAWCANLGTIVFHPWAVTAPDVDHPDELRLDLDPQPGTDFHDAVRAAAVLRDILDELGMTGWPKTSGGRGLHIFVPIEPRWDFIDVRHAAIAIGREMSRRAPELVTVEWWKENRGQRIFLDYNQNARDRTIASAFSVRPRALAPVSTPLTWDEVPETDPGDWTIATVPDRIAEVGDVHADRWGQAFDLTPALELYDGDEMPYPPDYPKMPGEPKRVQPSRNTDLTRGNVGKAGESR
ncbi:MAG: non-homologous end-joining DNA ligase [Candidatus Nanopelagicales bacterium]